MTAYRRRAEIQEAPYDGELILFNPKNWHTVSLNSSAAAFWEALTWPQTAVELRNLLREAEPALAEEECSLRIDTLLTALLTHDLIEPVGKLLSVNNPPT